jgi:hypothetical protein
MNFSSCRLLYTGKRCRTPSDITISNIRRRDGMWSENRDGFKKIWTSAGKNFWLILYWSLARTPTDCHTWIFSCSTEGIIVLMQNTYRKVILINPPNANYTKIEISTKRKTAMKEHKYVSLYYVQRVMGKEHILSATTCLRFLITWKNIKRFFLAKCCSNDWMMMIKKKKKESTNMRHAILGSFANMRKDTTSFVMSVRPSAGMEQLV